MPLSFELLQNVIQYGASMDEWQVVRCIGGKDGKARAFRSRSEEGPLELVTKPFNALPRCSDLGESFTISDHRPPFDLPAGRKGF